MNKIYVLDTNVLLQDPFAVFSFEDNEVVIPAIVLEEVDSKKRYMDEVGRNARQVAKIMDRFRGQGKLHDKVSLEGGGELRVELNHRSFEKLKETFDEKTNDNRILAVALNISIEENAKDFGKPVILVTKDALLRVKADVIGILAEDFLSDRVIQSDHIYPGYLEIFVSLNILNKFYSDQKISVNELNCKAIYPNQFVILKDELGSSSSAIGVIDKNRQFVLPFQKEFEHLWGIKPRNVQ